jgi:AraC family mar-sox-rob regulon transcriptional activator
MKILRDSHTATGSPHHLIPQPEWQPTDLPPCELETVIGDSEDALSRTTRQVLRLLLNGDLSELSSERIADALGISPTTLRRRLRADRTHYQTILDQVRQYRCEQRLVQRWLPGKCLAWELGYAEVNSFYRAFRRWTGRNYSDMKLRYV